MKNSLLFSIKIILFGIILPFKIWKISKDKLDAKSNIETMSGLLDEDYIATSWLDWYVDAIIFLIYPIGLIISIIISIVGYQADGKLLFLGIIGLIPLYFIPLFISFARELGGSFMLLHMNVKRIRKYLDDSNC